MKLKEIKTFFLIFNLSFLPLKNVLAHFCEEGFSSYRNAFYIESNKTDATKEKVKKDEEEVERLYNRMLLLHPSTREYANLYVKINRLSIDTVETKKKIRIDEQESEKRCAKLLAEKLESVKKEEKKLDPNLMIGKKSDDVDKKKESKIKNSYFVYNKSDLVNFLIQNPNALTFNNLYSTCRNEISKWYVEMMFKSYFEDNNNEYDAIFDFIKDKDGNWAIAGFSIIRKIDSSLEKEGHVDLICSNGGSGGGIILQTVENIICKRGFEKISLNPIDSAVKFYEHMGYQNGKSSSAGSVEEQLRKGETLYFVKEVKAKDCPKDSDVECKKPSPFEKISLEMKRFLQKVFNQELVEIPKTTCY